MSRRSRRTIPLVAAFALAAAVAAPAQGASLKPNLFMDPPYQVQMTTDGSGASFVAFGAAIGNRGPGILKVKATRPSGSDLMDASQVLMTTNDLNTATADQTIPNVGQLQFSPSPSHFHWHFLHFENYQLLSVPDLNFVAPTRKTGFCISGLNKGYYCAGGNPNETQMGQDPDGSPTPGTTAMGLMPAGAPMTSNQSSSDDYGPTIEGQDIEITNLPSARYCLSFTVNPDDKLVETTTADNGSSAFIDVGGTPGGARTVSQPLDSEGDPIVFSNSSTCGLSKSGPAPKVKPLTRRMAAKLTRRALRKSVRGKPSGVTGTCRTRGKSKAICTVSFRSAKARYRGSVTITQRVSTGQLRWYYKVNVKRTKRGACSSSGKCPSKVRTKNTFGGILGAGSSSKVALKAASYRSRRVPTLKGAAWPAWYLLKLNDTPRPNEPLPLPPVGPMGG